MRVVKHPWVRCLHPERFAMYIYLSPSSYKLCPSIFSQPATFSSHSLSVIKKKTEERSDHLNSLSINCYIYATSSIFNVLYSVKKRIHRWRLREEILRSVKLDFPPYLSSTPESSQLIPQSTIMYQLCRRYLCVFLSRINLYLFSAIWSSYFSSFSACSQFIQNKDAPVILISLLPPT